MWTQNSRNSQSSQTSTNKSYLELMVIDVCYKRIFL